MELSNVVKVRVGEATPVPLSDLVSAYKAKGKAEETREYYVEPDSEYYIPNDVISFAGMQAHRVADEKARSIRQTTEEFKSLLDNVMWNSGVTDKLAAMRVLMAEFESELTLSMNAELEETVIEESISESMGSGVLTVAEMTSAEPLIVEVALIEPGFGNDKDNHYYPKETLKKAAERFKGVKMYLTNHVKDEHNLRTEVSEVLECPVRFTESGAPVARVGIFDPIFAANVANRDKLGTLDNLQCSILGTGKVKRNGIEIDGRKGHLVEDIVDVKSVDWVPRAGAGGRALNIVESDEGGNMPEETQEVVEQEPTEPVVEPIQETEQESEPEKTLLTADVVLPLLLASDLPKQTLGRLAEVQYENEDAVKTAIADMQSVIAEVAEAAKIKNMGATKQPDRTEEKPLEERELAVIRRYMPI